MLKIIGGTALLLLVATSTTVAQGAVSADSIMQLNRSGLWIEAAELAHEVLGSADQLSVMDRCKAHQQLAYAHSRTDRRDSARAVVRRVLAECAVLGDHWVIRDAGRLSEELDEDRIALPTIRSNDGWSTASAAGVGLDSTALNEHRILCEQSGADACLIAYRGTIVQEWYGPGYGEPMSTMSSVKSWTALLAGLLIAEGKIGLDDPVEKWIPEWIAGSEAEVTVRHLLSMTAGLHARDEPGTSVGYVSDKNALVLSLPLTYSPGERWEYSNEGAQLLSPILERAAGVPLQDYARERLFEPLGMMDTELRLDAAGSAWTYADAKTTLRDFAKICQAVLDNGRSLTGQQVIPEWWVAEVTDPTEQNTRYGLLWWLDGNGSVVATRGYLDTDCTAIRALNLVIARMQTRPAAGTPEPYYGARLRKILEQMMQR